MRMGAVLRGEDRRNKKMRTGVLKRGEDSRSGRSKIGSREER